MDKVKVKFFAAFREIVGQGELNWPLQKDQTAASVLAGLAQDYPGLTAGSSTVLVMVNQRYADRQTLLQPGDEVAFLPPVGGGQF